MIAEYLNTVLEEGGNSEVITAIGHIAKSIGMTKIADETGLSRPKLYKALSDGAKPQFGTIMKVLKAIGGQIRINPMPACKQGIKSEKCTTTMYKMIMAVSV